MKKTPQEAALLRKQELDDIGELMSSPAGRRFIWRFLEAANMFEPCFTGNSSTFYNEGRRDLGLVMYKDVMHYEDLYFLMVKENRINKENGNGGRS